MAIDHNNTGARHGTFLSRLDSIDRRWIFLMMALAVAGPIIWVGITGKTFPETPTPAVQGAFDALEKLPEGSRVLVSFDYDPASAGELQPMATAIIHHCVIRKLRICGMALWAPGGPLIGATFTDVIGNDPSYVYGVNFADLGYQAGNEGVMKQAGADFPRAFPNDARSTPFAQVPMLKDIHRLSDFDLLVCISAGYPGAKEWIQYGVSPTMTGGKPLPFVAGTTGVQTPQLIPYYPGQMAGVLGAIKGAAEYESLVNTKLRSMDSGKPIAPKFQEAQRRMAPQLVAHVLMVGLIVVGNVIFFAGRRKGAHA
ncbi:MAG: hypothetical protein WCO75_05590 [Planctomycetota bacterium]